jgi:hypothetical protein
LACGCRRAIVSDIDAVERFEIEKEMRRMQHEQQCSE